MSDKLAEAIERVRKWARIGGGVNQPSLACDVLAVCDAAAQCAEAESKLAGAEHWINHEGKDALAALGNCGETLAGIERLLRAGLTPQQDDAEGFWFLQGGQWSGGRIVALRPTLAAAVQAALAELECPYCKKKEPVVCGMCDR